MIAASEGHHLVVRELARCKSDLDLRCGEGKTATYMAAEAGHRSVCNELRLSGANVGLGKAATQSRRSEGTTPGEIAKALGHLECLEVLGKHGLPFIKKEKRDSLAFVIMGRVLWEFILESLIERVIGMKQRTLAEKAARKRREMAAKVAEREKAAEKKAAGDAKQAALLERRKKAALRNKKKK